MAYTVKKGDTPGRIARALGVPTSDIMAISSAFSRPGDARTLQIGAVIDLGGGGQTAETTAPVVETTPAPTPSPAAYTVKKGDTPSGIAKALGVSVADIMAITSAFSRPGDARTLQIGAVIDLAKAGGGTGGKGDYTDEEATRFNGLPGQPEIWEIDGEAYVVYFAPGTEPPVPLLYSIPTDEDLKSFFGDQTPRFDKKITMDQANATGAIPFGSTDTIPATEGDPWAGFLERMERARKVQPWLADPEVFAVVSGAWLEGRSPEQWEFEATDWWQTHNEAQREWLWISMRDPEEASRLADDNYITVYEAFRAIGLDNVDDGLINYMADQFTQGHWSKQYLEEQLAAATGDPSAVVMDTGLAKFMGESGISIADPSVGRNQVLDMFDRWLGPAHGPSDQQIRDWSAKIRRDPNAGQASLEQYLRGQRKALFPEYEDDSLTYEDIAGPWRGFSASIWGQQLDETSDVFQQVIRLNDSMKAGELLRKEGLAQNIGQVRQDALKGMMANVSNVRVTL